MTSLSELDREMQFFLNGPTPGAAKAAVRIAYRKFAADGHSDENIALVLEIIRKINNEERS